MYHIKCGKLYDGIQDCFQEDMQILVENNIIKEVGRNLKTPTAAETIDLSGKTVTPGLIDAHVHADFWDTRVKFQDRLLFTDNWRMMSTLHCANKALKRGFTTLRTMGSFRSHTQVSVDAKRAIDMGYMEGSRLVVSAGLGTTGSHGDQSGSFSNNPELSDFAEDFSSAIGNGPEFFLKEVRKQRKYGNDFIKIMATGGFATPNDSPEDQQLNDEELKTIIETAHQVGLTVTAHAYSGKLITNLVTMGIDGIEHGAMITEDAARLMETKGTYLVPTFCPYDDIVRLDEKSLASKTPHFRDKLRKYAQRIIDSREIIINSKIKLGYGTDFVAVHNSYDCGYEYDSWIKSGMSPFRILKAATTTNSSILGRDDIGSIEPGKLADISAWGRDLLTDSQALLDCAFVMKDGKVYPTESSL